MYWPISEIEKMCNINLVLFFFVISFVKNGQFQQSPCPGIFQYKYHPTYKQTYGEFKLTGIPDSNLKISVKVSVPAKLSSSYLGMIRAENYNNVVKDFQSQGYVLFDVFLPTEKPRPLLSSIKVNDREICSGPPAEGSYVTFVTLQYTIDLSNIIPRGFTFSQPSQINCGRAHQIHNRNQPLRTVVEQRQKPVATTTRPITTRPPTQPVSQSPQPTVTHQTEKPEANIRKKATSTSVQPTTVTTKKPVVNIRRTAPSTTVQPTTTTTKKPEDVVADICGTTAVARPLVLYGTPAIRGDNPWHAAIFVRTEIGIEYRCGGSLISQKHVVTAAHCLNSGAVTKKDLEKFIVMLGKYHLHKYNEKYSKILDIISVAVHSDYVDHNPDADIGIMTLEEDVEFTAYIRPICLFNPKKSNNDLYSKQLTIVGWGRDEDGNRVSKVLKETKVRVVTQEACLRSHDVFRSQTSDRTFCADGVKNGSLPCTGDSGGGIYFEQNKRQYLRGIISTSLAYNETYYSCHPDAYFIAVDMSRFYSWIKEEINYYI